MTVDRFAFWFAALLSFGSLVFYVITAFAYRREPDALVDAHEDFNLGLPRFRNVSAGFGASLLAAGTSLSTVLVFFLTATPLFGWWLLLCPLMFTLGNVVLYLVYKRAVANGYFAESSQQFRGSAGLVPFLILRLTGSNTAGWVALLLSAMNLLAVLSLELIVGIQVLQYLLKGALDYELGPSLEFVAYAISVVLLLGYVFVGGFRASIASDQYQAMAMKIAMIVTTIAMVLVWWRSPSLPDSSGIPLSVPFNVLGFFVLNVVLANLFVPLAQEASWQRYRAFKNAPQFDPRAATTNAVIQSGWLWTLIIATSLLLYAVVAPQQRQELSVVTGSLDHVRSLDRAWFPLLVFPLLVVAGLSAMYSTADTCVSALLYLLEYSRKRTNGNSTPDARTLDPPYYFAMLTILILSLGVYGFVRYAFSPTIMQLVFSVFSNLVVVAPAVLLTGVLRPISNGYKDNKRSRCVIVSVLLGCFAYWVVSITAMILGGAYLWLSQVAIAAGLVGAVLPLIPVIVKRSSDGKCPG